MGVTFKVIVTSPKRVQEKLATTYFGVSWRTKQDALKLQHAVVRASEGQ